ncbi:MAG: metallophosphoesterase [Schleiferiaceae bacterium]|nr:metallophosphoesterase [Schleiferiaceae bacterium]
MDVLVVGDVHGCYHTFKALVKRHWNPDRMFLIQVGDLINKGVHSVDTFLYAKKLKKQYPYHVYFIKGNHELLFEEQCKSARPNNAVRATLSEFARQGLSPAKLERWIGGLPLKWETPHMLITHAGIAKDAENPFDEKSELGVLWNRSPIKKMQKVQVYGHKYLDDGKPMYNIKTNSWNVDTAAWLGRSLTAVLFDYQGNKKDVFSLPTDARDLNKLE